MARKTIRFTDESESDIDTLRTILEARMPLMTRNITDTDIVAHALKLAVRTEQATEKHDKKVDAKRRAKR